MRHGINPTESGEDNKNSRALHFEKMGDSEFEEVARGTRNLL
jgi:hypothetical protein